MLHEFGIDVGRRDLNQIRKFFASQVLTDGSVLVVGGEFFNGSNNTNTAELYDPSSGIWTSTDSLANARWDHTATLLPNGQLLVAGGDNDGISLASAELYDVGLGFTKASQPRINAVRNGGNRFQLTGKRFQGT